MLQVIKYKKSAPYFYGADLQMLYLLQLFFDEFA